MFLSFSLRSLHPFTHSSETSINLLGLESFPPQSGEDAVGPVVGGDVQRAEHLRGRDGFRIHPHLPVRSAAVRHGLHQRVDARRLPSAARTQRHHTCRSRGQLHSLPYSPCL